MNGEGDGPGAPPGVPTGLFTGDLSVREVLAQLRRRLLDLTARNRLLNFRHSPTKTVQVVDAYLSVIYERLMDNRPLTFLPVPDPAPYEYEGESRNQKPEVRAYAGKLGIKTSFELPAVPPDERTTGGQKLRVIAYPEDTERLCRRLFKEARSAIEETGTNMLYLVFGFLEYYESDASDRPLLAPLIAVPVEIKKGPPDRHSRLPIYEVTYAGDEVVENLSLREKLSLEFAMVLPEFREEQGLEKYLSEVAEAVATRRRWKVRRQVTLTLLSFAKMLLVKDLDPTSWPQGFHRSKIEEHPLVRQVIGDFTGDGGAGTDQPDYEVDNHDKNNLSLIYDADTSQHSALIDALEEKNLVINGPPGTGKSQTITNLIAEALVRGKKVLFVSEKLAALQVVKSRLEKAKLGDFCLELHSHKTQKKRVVDDLKARHAGRYPKPPGLDGNLELLERQKKQLQAYAELMNTTLGNELELTVFQVLWRAERHRQQAINAAPFVDDIVVPDAPRCGPARLGLMTSEIKSFANHFDAIGQYGVNHPWFGLSPIQLRPGDDLEIQTNLKALIAAADGVDQVRVSLAAKGSETKLPVERSAQIALASTLRDLPEPPRTSLSDFLPRCFRPDGTGGAESAAVVNTFKRKVSEAKRLISLTEGKLIPSAPVSPELLERATAWRDRLSHHCDENLPLTTLASYKEEIVGLLTGITRSLEFFLGLSGLFGRAPEQTDAGLRKALAVLQVCNESPQDLLEYRQPSWGRPSTKELAAKAQAEYRRLSQVHTDLSSRFYLDSRPDAQELAAAIQAFREGEAWYRLFQGNWRRAHKFYKNLAKDKIRRPSNECLQSLTTLSQYFLDHDRSQTNAEFQESFGRLFKGDDTDYDKIGRLISWYERVHTVFSEASLAPDEFDVSAVEDYRIGQLSEPYALAQTHAKALDNALARLRLLTTGSHLAAEIQTTASSWPHRMEAARTFALELGDAAHFLKDIGPEALSPKEIVQALAGQLALRLLLNEIGGDAAARNLLGEHFAQLDTNFEDLEQTLIWGQRVATAALPQGIKRLLLSEKAAEAYPEIIRIGSALGEAWESVTKAANQMQQIAPFDWNQWNSALVDSPGNETTDEVRTRTKIALDNLDGLLSWSQYLNVRRALMELRLEPFVQKIEAGIVPSSLLGEGFLYRFYASIAKSLFQTNTTLSRFSGIVDVHPELTHFGR